MGILELAGAEARRVSGDLAARLKSCRSRAFIEPSVARTRAF